MGGGEWEAGDNLGDERVVEGGVGAVILKVRQPLGEGREELCEDEDEDRVHQAWQQLGEV